MFVRVAAVLGLLSLFLAGAFCFHPIVGVGLTLLAGWIYQHPASGLAFSFLVLSLDTVGTLPAGIVVSLSEFEVAVCILALLARCEGLRDWDWRPVIWWFPFLGAVMISGLVNIEWYIVLPHLVRNAELAVTALLALNVFRRMESGIWLDALLASAVFLQLGVSLEQLLSGTWQYGTRMVGSLSNPNQLAGWMGLIAVVAFGRLVGHWHRFNDGVRRSLRWVISSATIVGAFCGIFLAGSRTATVACAVGLFVAALLTSLRMSGRISYRVIASAGIFLVAAASLALLSTHFDSLRPLSRNLLSDTDRNFRATAENRLTLYKIGVGIWLEQPFFGAGPGRWEETARLQLEQIDDESRPFIRQLKAGETSSLAHAHNLPIQIAALYGLVGLAALIFAALSWWTGFYRCKGSMSSAGLALMAAFAVNNLADTLFPSLAMEIGWLMGLLLAGACRQTESGRS